MYNHYTLNTKQRSIAATNKIYDSYIHKTLPTKIIAFIALNLTLINFVFNSRFYKQTKCCGMRIISAPTYENTAMAEFEQKDIYPLIRVKSIIF